MHIFAIPCSIFFIWTFILFFFDFTVAHGNRKYYYVKVLESIQFVCSGISGSCRDASAVNTYRSTVYDLFLISAYVPMFAYPLDSPYYLNCFCSLHFQFCIWMGWETTLTYSLPSHPNAKLNLIGQIIYEWRPLIFEVE